MSSSNTHCFLCLNPLKTGLCALEPCFHVLHYVCSAGLSRCPYCAEPVAFQRKISLEIVDDLLPLKLRDIVDIRIEHIQNSIEELDIADEFGIREFVSLAKEVVEEDDQEFNDIQLAKRNREIDSQHLRENFNIMRRGYLHMMNNVLFQSYPFYNWISKNGNHEHINIKYKELNDKIQDYIAEQSTLSLESSRLLSQLTQKQEQIALLISERETLLSLSSMPSFQELSRNFHSSKPN